MTKFGTFAFEAILIAVLDDDRDLAWGLIQNLTPVELDEFEDALDTLQDLVDARRAGYTLQIAAADLLDHPQTPP